jgi:hypothetical protein
MATAAAARINPRVAARQNKHLVFFLLFRYEKLLVVLLMATLLFLIIVSMIVPSFLFTSQMREIGVKLILLTLLLAQIIALDILVGSSRPSKFFE